MGRPKLSPGESAYEEFEQMIIVLASQGFGHKEIAARLGVKFSTIETHIERIRHKWGARNMAHLIHLWHEKAH